VSIHGHESEMKAATAYERRGMVFVHSLSRTTEGIWILCDPVLALNGGGRAAIGKGIKDCLAASVDGVKHPQAFGSLFASVLKLAKSRSYKEFVRGAKCVEIFEENECIKLFSTKNMGADEGFVQSGMVKECFDNSHIALGEALAVAMLDSEAQ
jgi:hypothetical protein